MNAADSPSAPRPARPILMFACSGAADVGLIADLGLRKGESPATDEAIATVCAAARAMLAS